MLPPVHNGIDDSKGFVPLVGGGGDAANPSKGSLGDYCLANSTMQLHNPFAYIVRPRALMGKQTTMH